MHAVCLAGARDIDAVVDENARRRSPRDAHDVAHDRGKRLRLEIPFAHLNEIDTRRGSRLRLRHKPAARDAWIRVAPPSSIGDEAHHHVIDSPPSSMAPDWGRAPNRSDRSAKPAMRLIIPRPLTAARRNALLSAGCSAGQLSAK